DVSPAFLGDGCYEIQFIQPRQANVRSPLEKPGYRLGEEAFDSPCPSEKRKQSSQQAVQRL
ncbi:MAG: hypothetical protein ACRDTR_25125, partial [Rubrobacter sp.]